MTNLTKEQAFGTIKWAIGVALKAGAFQNIDYTAIISNALVTIYKELGIKEDNNGNDDRRSGTE